MSKLLGEVTAEDVATSHSRQHFFEVARKTRTRRLVARPLVSREEMNNWPADIGLLDPHGAPPTKIVAPRINQRRVGKVTNPFYRYGQHLGQGNSIDLVKSILSARRFRALTEPLTKDQLSQHPPVRSDPALEPKYVISEPKEVPPPQVTKPQTEAKLTQEPRHTEALLDEAPVETPEPVSVEPEAKPQHPRQRAKPPRAQALRPDSTLPNVPQGELMHSFRGWISGLRWKSVPISVYTVRADGQDRVSKILFERFPGALRHEYLDIWKKRKWIQIRQGKFGIIGTGANVLCKNQLQAFMDAATSQVIDVGDANERVVVKERVPVLEKPRAPEKPTEQLVDRTAEHGGTAQSTKGGLTPQTRAALLVWYATNRTACANAYLHEQLRSLGKSPPLKGFIEERRFLLRKDLIDTLVGHVSTSLTAFDVEHHGKPVPFCVVPGELALRLEPLKTWLLEHQNDLRPYTNDVIPRLQDGDVGFINLPC